MKSLRRSTSSSSVPSTSSPSLASSWIHLRSLLIVASATVPDRGSLRSPWSRRKRKRALSHSRWRNLLSPDGKFHDGGVKFLIKVRRGGVDPSIRAEVWPFLLGVFKYSQYGWCGAEKEEIRLHQRKREREVDELAKTKCGGGSASKVESSASAVYEAEVVALFASKGFVHDGGGSWVVVDNCVGGRTSI